MDTIDWRVIDDPDGLPLKWRVSVYPDCDSKPDDCDCYTPRQHTAWKNDEWSYVGVEVTPILPSGHDLSLATETLWGTEYGFLTLTDDDDNKTGEKNIDLEELIKVHPVPELLVQARGELLDQLGPLMREIFVLAAGLRESRAQESPQLRAVREYVREHPGCTRQDAAEAVGSHGSRKHGYAAVDRALRAGLINLTREGRKKYLYPLPPAVQPGNSGPN
jgi:hypothetical protein